MDGSCYSSKERYHEISEAKKECDYHACIHHLNPEKIEQLEIHNMHSNTNWTPDDEDNSSNKNKVAYFFTALPKGYPNQKRYNDPQDPQDPK